MTLHEASLDEGSPFVRARNQEIPRWNVQVLQSLRSLLSVRKTFRGTASTSQGSGISTTPWPRMFKVFQRVLSAIFGVTWPNETLLRRTVDQKATEILRQMQSGNFAGVCMQLMPILWWIATESMLRNGWELLCMAAGPVVKVGRSNVSVGFLTTAKVPIDFRRSSVSAAAPGRTWGSLDSANLHRS